MSSRSRSRSRSPSQSSDKPATPQKADEEVDIYDYDATFTEDKEKQDDLLTTTTDDDNLDLYAGVKEEQPEKPADTQKEAATPTTAQPQVDPRVFEYDSDGDSNADFFILFQTLQYGRKKGVQLLKRTSLFVVITKVPGRKAALYIGNLTWWTTDQDIFDLLAEFGRLKQLRFHEDKTNGKSRGYCFAEFGDNSLTEKALLTLQERKPVLHEKQLILHMTSTEAFKKLNTHNRGRKERFEWQQRQSDGKSSGHRGRGRGHKSRGNYRNYGNRPNNYGGRGGGGGHGNQGRNKWSQQNQQNYYRNNNRGPPPGPPPFWPPMAPPRGGYPGFPNPAAYFFPRSSEGYRGRYRDRSPKSNSRSRSPSPHRGRRRSRSPSRERRKESSSRKRRLSSDRHGSDQDKRKDKRRRRSADRDRSKRDR